MADEIVSADVDTFMSQANFAAMRSALGLGTVATLAVDTDPTLAANSDARIASQKAVKAFVATAVTGVLKFKGSTDCSTNPNYPAATQGDAYVVSVAGKIGGVLGVSVAVGDVYFAIADNAGGTQLAVGTSWDVLEHVLAGALLAANNLSDLLSAATARANLGSTTVGDAVFIAVSAAAARTALALAAIAASGSANDLANFPVKQSVLAVSTTNLALTGEQTIDGQLSAASMVLLTGQTAPAENGPWVTAAGAWARPAWYASGNTVQAFQFITVMARLGTNYGGTWWRVTTSGAITIDTTGTTWSLVPVAQNGLTTTRAITTVADADYTVLTTDVNVAYTSITAARTVTLPATATISDGWECTIGDSSGSVTNTNRITIAAAGADTIQGAANTWIPSAYGVIRLRKRGTTFTIVATARLTQKDIFLASGTYTKPLWATNVSVGAFGGGGGGGSGRRGAAASTRGAGSGGGGSSLVMKNLSSSEVGATETVTVGAAGTGGAAASADDTNGANGGAGGTSSFGTLLAAPGGSAGVLGQAVAGTTANGAISSMFSGTAGGNGSSSGSGSAGGSSGGSSGAGGGGGAGLDTSNSTRNGFAGGASRNLDGTATTLTGGTIGAVGNGGNGQSVTAGTLGGGSGGGGGGTAAGIGGTGGSYGGGGGGGGASLNGTNSGAGGPGGPGIVIVVSTG